MAAANTYVAIATNTLGSATASVTFSSIPATYTDLVLVVNAIAATTTDGSITLRFNSDSSSNYSYTRILGLGSGTPISSRGTSTTLIFAGIISNSVLGTTLIQLNNYANTTTYKNTLARSGKADSYVSADVGLWRSTAAITSIVLAINDNNNFATGSTFTLYGILAA